MWSNYFFYLMGLPENEKNIQILIMIGFWGILLTVGIIADRIKKKISK